MSGAARRVGQIVPKTSSLFLCDMQEKFRPSISYFPAILEVSRRMLEAAKVLDMPVVVTEQYPKGLGPTCSELDVSGLPIFPKTRFSMCIPEVDAMLKDLKEVKSVIICGIESQACVQQTALELLDRDYDVHIVVDAVSSRSMVDRMYSLQRMREAGAFLTTSESMLLALTKDAAHPKFKEIQKLIWTSAPDSGLLGQTVNGETPV